MKFMEERGWLKLQSIRFCINFGSNLYYDPDPGILKGFLDDIFVEWPRKQSITSVLKRSRSISEVSGSRSQFFLNCLYLFLVFIYYCYLRRQPRIKDNNRGRRF